MDFAVLLVFGFILFAIGAMFIVKAYTDISHDNYNFIIGCIFGSIGLISILLTCYLGVFLY